MLHQYDIIKCNNKYHNQSSLQSFASGGAMQEGQCLLVDQLSALSMMLLVEAFSCIGSYVEPLLCFQRSQTQWWAEVEPGFEGCGTNTAVPTLNFRHAYANASPAQSTLRMLMGSLPPIS